ncbi:MAG: hypothetical protein UU08_C0031G0001 [Candidatus Uhrbacteria bacterium GW2011_GWE2_40_58]|nr:MAG: hypothetical protein UT94_C0031G0002 [Candidatus Uhrbacteria bacterium GW2011_GWF2_40_263]KKR66871.1 MAG: hypothetical protein UU08_C0031G0001 [Candidatus Uhrbacteria bacterium GW2011_GWE2_40_58]OGL97990.1 MAG: hypothetical protein A2332_00620 [Candidatus Uhrbacteria bacterium RIFOXYB2_FULL_41_18]
MTHLLPTPTPTPIYTGMKPDVSALVLSPNQQIIAIGYRCGIIVLWDLRTQSVIAKLRHPLIRSRNYSGIHDMSFLSPTRLFVTAGVGNCCIWDLKKRCVDTISNTYGCGRIHLSSDQKEILCLGPSGRIHFINTQTLKVTTYFDEERVIEYWPYCIGYLPLGTKFVTGDRSGNIICFDRTQPKQVRDGIPPFHSCSYKTFSKEITRLQVISDSSLLFADNAGKITYWKRAPFFQNKIPIQAWSVGPPEEEIVTYLALCPNEKHFIVGYSKKSVSGLDSKHHRLVIYDLEGNRCLELLNLFTDLCSSSLFGFDRYLVINTRWIPPDDDRFGQDDALTILDFGQSNLGMMHPIEALFGSV